MSFNSSILGVCVPPEEVHADIISFVDVTNFYSDARPSSVAFSSEVGAGMNLDRLLEAFPCEALHFVREPIAILRADALPAAMAALEQLFLQIAAQPGRALACCFWECTEEQIVDAARGPEVAPIPDVPQDEDGLRMQYAIGYLKSLLLVLRHAHAHQFTVVHGHSHHLDGAEV